MHPIDLQSVMTASFMFGLLVGVLVGMVIRAAVTYFDR